MAKAIVEHIVGRFLGKVSDVLIKPLEAATKKRKQALGQPTTPGIAEGDLLADVRGGEVVLDTANVWDSLTWQRNNQDPSDEYPVGRGSRRISEYQETLLERPLATPRTKEEAVEIARRAGVSWNEEEIELVVVDTMPSAFASYPVRGIAGSEKMTELEDWTAEPLRPGGPRRIVVKVPRSTLQNDLTIAAALHHEAMEARAVRLAYEANGGA